MAMSAEILGPLMQANIDALTDDQKRDRGSVFKALAAAIISHISTAASISGPCTGLANAGGPVAGVAVIPPGSIL